MTNLAKLKPTDENGCAVAVIETVKGSRTKLDYDVKKKLFAIDKVLPEGMSFPFDFGFIPSTLGEDGDPVDVIVLLDEPVPTATVVPSRLIGVIEAEQTDCDGKTIENDRLLAVGAASVLYRDVAKLKDLPDAVIEQIEQFFVTYNKAEGKKFRIKGKHGPKRARDCVTKGQRALRQAGRRRR